MFCSACLRAVCAVCHAPLSATAARRKRLVREHLVLVHPGCARVFDRDAERWLADLYREGWIAPAGRVPP